MKLRPIYILIIFILIAVVALPISQPSQHVQAASGSLTTTFADNNGLDGNMFDVVAINNITVTSFDINCQVTGSTYTYEVYYKVGAYVGSETTAGDWTFLGTADVNCITRGVPTALPIGGLSIPAGQTYGLYVTSNGPGGLAYTDGANTYSNSDLQIVTGVGISYPFGSTFTPRTWNGTIYYDASPAVVPSGISDDYSKIGQILVTEPGTALYEDAGGNVLRDASGAEIWVPNQTAHDPSQDTYDVISQTTVGDVTWVEIFVGDADSTVWVPVGGAVQIIELVE